MSHLFTATGPICSVGAALNSTRYSGVGMSLERAVIEFIEGLTLHQGRFAGQPFKLHPWQKRFVRGMPANGRGLRPYGGEGGR